MKRSIILSLSIAATAVGLGACTHSAANPESNASKTTNSAIRPADSTTENSPANPTVGGAAMLRTQDIVDNAGNSNDHTTLVTAIKSAGLVDTLKGPGPFTVFAPTNEAFDKLPKGTVDGLLKLESKATLTKILTYHVVPGKHDAAAIAKAIKDGGGKATFKTVAGGTLTASMDGASVILTDEKGGRSKVTIADVMQSNGVIHVVDTVLMPK